MMIIKETDTQAIRVEEDLIKVRQCVKNYTQKLKYSLITQTKLITAASEISRNTFKYGGGGNFTLQVVSDGDKQGLKLIFEDQGPGIADIDKALQDGYTTGKGMGLGLSGSRRLVNEFSIESAPGQGTRVTLLQWSAI